MEFVRSFGTILEGLMVGAADCIARRKLARSEVLADVVFGAVTARGQGGVARGVLSQYNSTFKSLCHLVGISQRSDRVSSVSDQAAQSEVSG